MPETLRVGVLCDGPVWQHWQAECLRQVLALQGAQLVVVAMRDAAPAPPVSALQRFLRHPWRIALYLTYRRRWSHPKAYAPEDMGAVLAQAPVLQVRPEVRKGRWSFPPEALDALRAQRPDVLLRFGFGILTGDILTTARFGVWSYHHGDEEHYRGQPPVIWEMIDGRTIVGAVLQRLTERLDAGSVLRKGWFRVNEASIEDTLDRVLLGSCGWAADVCRQLLAGQVDAAEGLPSRTSAPVRRYPGSLTFLPLLMRTRNGRGRKEQEEDEAEWNIGVLRQPISALLEERPSLNIRWLPSPALGQQRATPFGYMSEGALNVLYQKGDRSAGTSEISRLRPKTDNILKRSRTMLADAPDLSYPFILNAPGGPYVVPSQPSTGRVDLYRISGTNDKLERIGTLLDRPLHAPTLFQHAGRWWLFGTLAPAADAALHAFHAAELEGPYAEHLLNPIKVDVRSARPAGDPFVHEGQLYRPARDLSAVRDRGVHLMHVLELSPTRFSEEIARTIGPFRTSAWTAGCATISAVGDTTLVDGLRGTARREAAGTGRRHKRRRSSTDHGDHTDDDAS